jgi:hypothetical protein
LIDVDILDGALVGIILGRQRFIDIILGRQRFEILVGDSFATFLGIWLVTSFRQALDKL